MSSIADIYRKIETIQDVSVDRAMAAALPTSDPVDRVRMVLLLLKRNRPDGVIGLILHYHLLVPQLQRIIEQQAAHLFRPLREAAGRADSIGAANAIRIIQASASTRLAYLVCEKLRHVPNQLHELAAQCLLDMARAAQTDRGATRRPRIDAESSVFLQSAIAEAVGAFGRHGRLEVLVAMAAMLSRPMSASLAHLGHAKHPAVDAMKQLLVRPEQIEVRQSLLGLLCVSTLKEAVLDGLHYTSRTATLGQALTSAHLLLLAPIRLALGHVTAAEMLWPKVAEFKHWPASQSRGLAAWATTLSTDRLAKVHRLSMLRDSPDTTTRLFGLKRLLELGADGPQDPILGVIASYCNDSEPRIIRIAVGQLIRFKYPRLPKLLASLVQSKHEQVRRVASRRLAPVGFDRLWQGWPRLNRVRRTEAGRALLKINPNFHQMLADKLLVQDRATRLRALSMICNLNQGSFFTAALAQLTEHDDGHIASAAVKALGSSEGEVASYAIEQALQHEDERVRSNAVEALAVIGAAEHIDQLTEIAEAGENRAKATAIGALMDLRPTEALLGLRDMLEDDRSEHRISALWLIQELGVLEVARQVAEMSIADADPQVKEQADRVIKALISSVEPTKVQTSVATEAQTGMSRREDSS